jgi:CubicO group peptidase (beta-lactamase class C family)
VNKLLIALAAVLPLFYGAAGADDAQAWPVGTATTMWQEPYMVGSYRHWAEIYPVRIVEAGTPLALPRGAPIAALEFWGNGEKFTLESYIERARVTGLLVIKDGEIRLEAYGHGADATSQMTTQSVAKSITSTLVGIALGEGLIASLDDPIDRYVPELAASAYGGVPIEAILQMSSGVAWSEDYDSDTADSEIMWIAVVQERTQSVHDHLLSLHERDGEPFEAFIYKGVDTHALAWLLERVTGMSLSAYLSDRLWRPMGMEADASWGLDGEGAEASEVASAGFSAVLRDWGRLGLLMAQDGMWQGERLLPEGWVARATRPSRPQVMPGKLYGGYPMGYQYQWWTYPGERGAFTAQGVNGQFIHVDPSRGLVVVQTAVWPGFWENNLEHMFNDFVKAVARLTDPG